MAVINLEAPFKERVASALADKHLAPAVVRATDRFVLARQKAMTSIDGELLRTQTRQMKEDVLRNLPDYLEKLERNFQANGITVHWARDGVEAGEIVRGIGLQNGARTIVKSKSMATEEIHLNHILEQAGLKVVETDLGEYIIQLAGEPPSHIVAPVIHKRLEEIAEIFHEKLDMPRTMDPTEMTSAARVRLRNEFFDAQMGVSGCNFAIAETGTICIVTNEGNGRMVSSMPKVYVVVMGIEKVVPTVEDALLQLQALTRSATGQQMTVYCSMTSGPRQPDQPDGPEQVHVVLMDNGRLQLLERGYGESLMCIRCGACLNICPVYQEIGGHAYGSTYNGPIGAVISPALAPEIARFKELPHATTLCGACRDVCPVKIDLPRLLVDLRADLVEAKANPRLEQLAIQGYVKAMSSRETYERGGKLASLSTNLLAGLTGGEIKWMPPPLSGWTDHRDFPPFAKKSFREWWEERQKLRNRE
ncbi:MAG: iron-sulfur cluster-binding protein [Caldilineaceae bacterium]|nr:iron-sulfur cluster-binding protein [Caldilineaceae bacterium]